MAAVTESANIVDWSFHWQDHQEETALRQRLYGHEQTPFCKNLGRGDWEEVVKLLTSGVVVLGKGSKKACMASKNSWSKMKCWEQIPKKKKEKRERKRRENALRRGRRWSFRYFEWDMGLIKMWAKCLWLTNSTALWVWFKWGNQTFGSVADAPVARWLSCIR